MPPSIPSSSPPRLRTEKSSRNDHNDKPSVTSTQKAAINRKQAGSEVDHEVRSGSDMPDSKPLATNQRQTSAPSFNGLFDTPSTSFSPMFGSMYGGGMYGGGMYGGMYGMNPYANSSFMPWLSNLNQFLFGVQTVIMSLGQAVQILGMNTDAVRQLLEAATAMFDHAVATWHEMQVIEKESRKKLRETEEDIKKRRRLRALRWTLAAALTYASYKIVRRLFRRRPMISTIAHETGQIYYNGNGPPQQTFYGPSQVTPFGSNHYHNPYLGSSPGNGYGYY